jgi:phytoene dehydrogenase-like protein
VEKTAYADTIIANAAIPNVVNLLPQLESEKLVSKINGLENSCSIITLYLGFKTSPKILGNKYYSTFLVNNETINLSDFANNLKYSGFEKRQMVFVDYSQIESGLAPEGKSLGVIATSDYAKEWEGLTSAEYKNRKEEISQIMIDRLEAFLPGIKMEIEYYELGTAKTIEKYTLNPGGSPYGFAQTINQSGLKRIGIKSPVKGLYFASAWTFPGGGFTGAIISGYLCAKKILK